ncbi:inositol monophosphatase [Candidatus Woesearchaeota archaeon]|jgi:myo-inositol-1(or 4)-monophosphatase|nr:inositol monophosphatase [Candidatus Woesearchaeota archaeon]|tara:strand:+ start:16545 stop:17300 length:756 start_codon:yes stop_codon:yes gene_type:complete
MNFKSTALLAARKAGKVLLKYYGKKPNVMKKSDKTFVSKADIEANKAIIDTIKKNFPDHSILSEETGFEDNKSDYKWVLDPLDGTHNFIHEIPLFGTSIALEYKDKPIVGVLHFPILRQTVVAEKGKGAFLNGKKVHVSNKKTFEHSLIVVDYGYRKRQKKLNFLQNLTDERIDVRNLGSAIYGLLLVSCGNSDGYVIISTNEWDIAAGFLIVEEAGGKITDLNGRNTMPQHEEFVMSNGKLHKELLKRLK